MSKNNINPGAKTDKDQAEAQEQVSDLTDPGAGEGAREDEGDSFKVDEALTDLQEAYDKLNDKYLRMYSEFENFRRRTAKEKLDSIRNAGADVVKELLPVVDDFDRAIANNEHTEDPAVLKEAFGLIHSKLMRTLERQGLKPMNSLHEPFDTEYHEAITNIPAPEEGLVGKVVDVAEKGYFFHDAILRYAKVVVGQ